MRISIGAVPGREKAGMDGAVCSLEAGRAARPPSSAALESTLAGRTCRGDEALERERESAFECFWKWPAADRSGTAR